MTVQRWTDEMLDQLAQKVDILSDKLDRQTETLDALAQKLDRQSDKIDAEIKRQDERFFQLTRDNLMTSRAIIVTAGTVIILSPVFQALAPAIETIFCRGDRG